MHYYGDMNWIWWERHMVCAEGWYLLRMQNVQTIRWKRKRRESSVKKGTVQRAPLMRGSHVLDAIYRGGHQVHSEFLVFCGIPISPWTAGNGNLSKEVVEKWSPLHKLHTPSLSHLQHKSGSSLEAIIMSVPTFQGGSNNENTISLPDDSLRTP